MYGELLVFKTIHKAFLNVDMAFDFPFTWSREIARFLGFSGFLGISLLGPFLIYCYFLVS